MVYHRLRNHFEKHLLDADLRECLRGCARWLYWDSSPQFRRDYVFAVLRTVLCKYLPRLLHAHYSLCDMWCKPSDPEFTPEQFEDPASRYLEAWS